MIVVFRRLLLVAAMAFGLAMPAAAASFSPDQENQVRAIVRDYLLKNPELIEQAQAALAAKRAAEKQARLAPKLAKLVRDPRRFSVGPANAKITIVEFFDYRCPYCKAAFEWTQTTVKANRDVRMVFVEFPILGPNSLEASKAAVASMKQGKYLSFHDALMRSKGDLNANTIDAIARASGVDVARMRRDMNDPAILTLLQEDQDFASEADVNATPTFFINGQFYSGFNPDEMDKVLRRLRGARG